MPDEDRLRVVDTDEALTLDELRELKKLAALSKTTKIVAAVVFGAVSLLGLPTLIDLWSKNHG